MQIYSIGCVVAFIWFLSLVKRGYRKHVRVGDLILALIFASMSWVVVLVCCIIDFSHPSNGLWNKKLF